MVNCHNSLSNKALTTRGVYTEFIEVKYEFLRTKL